MADNTFTNAGEFQYRRGKGNRQTRLGPRTATEGPRRASAKTLTPDQIALNKLGKLLEKPGISRNDRYAYLGMLANAEQLRFMNMPVVAQVLLFMRSVGNDINDQNFTYVAILPYINQLLPRNEPTRDGLRTKQVVADDLERMRLRLAATFLRYTLYILTLRQEQEQLLQAAQLADAQAGAVVAQQFTQ